mmetsp:Transcript_39450/g.91525  ORF Transcript_39450/g.91525 Transcript_39450/m.91525 type:complete len:142 (+) Transcript_39450:131-556(+)
MALRSAAAPPLPTGVAPLAAWPQVAPCDVTGEGGTLNGDDPPTAVSSVVARNGDMHAGAHAGAAALVGEEPSEALCGSPSGDALLAPPGVAGGDAHVKSAKSSKRSGLHGTVAEVELGVAALEWGTASGSPSKHWLDVCTA